MNFLLYVRNEFVNRGPQKEKKKKKNKEKLEIRVPSFHSDPVTLNATPYQVEIQQQNSLRRLYCLSCAKTV